MNIGIELESDCLIQRVSIECNSNGPAVDILTEKQVTAIECGWMPCLGNGYSNGE